MSFDQKPALFPKSRLWRSGQGAAVLGLMIILPLAANAQITGDPSGSGLAPPPPLANAPALSPPTYVPPPPDGTLLPPPGGLPDVPAAAPNNPDPGPEAEMIVVENMEIGACLEIDSGGMRPASGNVVLRQDNCAQGPTTSWAFDTDIVYANLNGETWCMAVDYFDPAGTDRAGFNVYASTFCNGEPNQIWTPDDPVSNTLSQTHDGEKYCLTVAHEEPIPDYDGKPGVNIIVWPFCDSSGDQLFGPWAPE